MENQFVPYELAVKLKELGFDEPCFYYFNKSENNQLWQDVDSCFYRNSKVSKGNLLWGETYDNGNVATPLWQQAFDWFRKNGLSNVVIENSGGYHYSINKNWYSFMVNSPVYKTYEEARQSCLEKLIEIANGD